jgi:hypothetical protein
MAARIMFKGWCVLLLVKEIMVVKTQQLTLAIGTAIWWVTEPDSSKSNLKVEQL